DDDTTLFTGMIYLGCAIVNAPRSELEVNRNMVILNNQSNQAVQVTLAVPSHSQGAVYLLDPSTNQEIASFCIQQILFCARGPNDTKESKCFAFTCSHSETVETAIFQCHVFRSDDADNVGKILYNFATAFRRTLKAQQQPATSTSQMATTSSTTPATSAADCNLFHFDVTLDIKELDPRSQTYVSCPKDKNVIKMRCNVPKKVVIHISQMSGLQSIKLDKCFGVLLGAGRNIKTSEMNLLEIEDFNKSVDCSTFNIAATWDPTLSQYNLINAETPKDSRMFMTVAVDVVMDLIREPIRFLFEVKVKVFPTNQKFWYFTNKSLYNKFAVRVKEVGGDNDDGGDDDIVRKCVTTSPPPSSSSSPSSSSPPPPSSSLPPSSSPLPSSSSPSPDNDEPLLSGSGAVSKEVTDEALLDSWKDVLIKWHQNVSQRPKTVEGLVRRGVPEALRGEVWQLLVGCTDDQQMFETYRLLIAKDSPSEEMIQRDLNRTFPAHEFFKDVGGGGQESLYKICKAYSVYDEEINYCQGVSFLTAALLLHMPEEQAFCVLTKIMYDYKLRDLFRQDFEDLHLKFYQLERCMEDQLPDLYDHFMDLGLEAHMYASQWFLTLFTAKFPLFLVFYILDLFISEGMSTIFGIALALLKMSRKDLLTLDFEGVLKYFRVHLPKKYRCDEVSKEMINMAISLKPSNKKLKKYETVFKTFRESQLQQEDPVDRLKRDNKRLQETNMRLERENDDLASELVNSKIQLRGELDKVEDKYDYVNKELLLCRSQLVEVEEEKKRLEGEVGQLKDLCRRESEQATSNNAKNMNIIQDYKQICSELSMRIESLSTSHKKELKLIKEVVERCASCRDVIVSRDGSWKDPPTSQQQNAPASESADLSNAIQSEQAIRDLELELAQTKLALVECECKNQELIHQLTSSSSSSPTPPTSSASSSLSSSSSSTNKNNSWLQKTLTSIKEATTNVKAGGITFGGN
ncbi:hypothetical protein HELRODRAFT_91542, partial [Helobdella robusta]|uniref:Rab GTPase-activating protein 1 n=1 Tax=Helobdella robusta TaxID=6412 RepID=T1G852_HELRO